MKSIVGATFAIVFFVASFFIVVENLTVDYDFEECIYVVESGDCLWSIASDYCPNGMDRHEYIDLIKERNGLASSIIYPGQRIVVLVCQGE